jgi:hypothetical protein
LYINLKRMKRTYVMISKSRLSFNDSIQLFINRSWLITLILRSIITVVYVPSALRFDSSTEIYLGISLVYTKNKPDIF